MKKTLKDSDKQKHKNENVSKSFLEKTKNFYIKEYKKLFLILVFLTFFSIFTLINTYIKTSDFTRKDVSLKGGLSLSINKELKLDVLKDLEKELNENFPKASINLRQIESAGKITGFIIEATDLEKEQILEIVEKKTGKLDKNDYSLEVMGSSLGESFFKQMFIALAIAFLGMAIVFHIYFKNIYATFAAIFSAFLDLFITLGFMNLFEIRLTAGGIAAYLMLIGYSVDTSILLSTKVLKEKKEDINSGIFEAMKTGLTMSFSGLAAMGLSFLLTNNEALRQIMLILVVGLLMDIITTWIGNVAFLRFYMERKEKKN
ncbi:MAG: MMPL family transporter [Candidatus Woesearchaeota archaeon]